MAENKVALITGGARGLGRSLALHLAGKGYKILVLDIVPAEDVDKHLQSVMLGYFPVDLSEETALCGTLDEILLKYGSIGVLINNASSRAFSLFRDFDESEMRKTIAVNFEAPVMIIKKIYPGMKEQAFGRIINISSVSAFRGYSTGTLYCSTKSALITFTQAFGRELRAADEDITVNVLCPESFSTREGGKLKNHDRIVRAIAAKIDRILASRMNAEVIPIVSAKSRMTELILDVKKHLLWLK